MSLNMALYGHILRIHWSDVLTNLEDHVIWHLHRHVLKFLRRVLWTRGHFCDIMPNFLNITYVYICSLTELIHMAFHIHGIIKDYTKITDILVWMFELSIQADNHVMCSCLGDKWKRQNNHFCFAGIELCRYTFLNWANTGITMMAKWPNLHKMSTRGRRYVANKTGPNTESRGTPQFNFHHAGM